MILAHRCDSLYNNPLLASGFCAWCFLALLPTFVTEQSQLSSCRVNRNGQFRRDLRTISLLCIQGREDGSTNLENRYFPDKASHSLYDIEQTGHTQYYTVKSRLTTVPLHLSSCIDIVFYMNDSYICATSPPF